MTNANQMIARINAAAHAAGTAESIVQFDNIGTHRQYRIPYEAATKHVRPGDRALDWGCGSGHFSLLLEELQATTTGYSFDEAPSCMAQSSSFVHVQGSVDDPRALPFATDSFDVACSVGVLEHVWETGGDERDSLRELARVLRPGGVFLTFHLPNRTGWIEAIGSRLHLIKHFHHRKYSEREIQTLWHDAGFDIIHIGRYNSLPRNELRRLPKVLRHNRAFVELYDAIDRGLTWALPATATNYFVIARKR